MALQYYLYTKTKRRLLLLEELVAKDQEGSGEPTTEENNEKCSQPVPVANLEWQVLKQKRQILLCDGQRLNNNVFRQI